MTWHKINEWHPAKREWVERYGYSPIDRSIPAVKERARGIIRRHGGLFRSLALGPRNPAWFLATHEQRVMTDGRGDFTSWCLRPWYRRWISSIPFAYHWIRNLL